MLHAKKKKEVTGTFPSYEMFMKDTETAHWKSKEGLGVYICLRVASFSSHALTVVTRGDVFLFLGLLLAYRH